MSVSTSPYGLSRKEEEKRNLEISKLLREEKKKLDSQIRLLLLGCGESGKSTLAKQMQIIHLGAFKNKEELLEYKPLIYTNIIQGFQTLIEETFNFSYKIEDEETANEIRKINANEDNSNGKILNSIIKLWDDKAIQQTYERRSEYQLVESFSYYIEPKNLNRIIKYEEYVPTVDDVLHSRKKTTGVHEILFEIEEVPFRLIDVGGQRSERKSKWMSLFSDVTSVIFCVALSEYDLKLEEDNTTNRMHESLKVFKEVSNNKWLVNTPIILFLNKKDLFEEKIKKVDLKVCFPQYKGPSANYNAASDYIKNQFLEQTSNKQKPIYVHITMATDTENIRVVFNAVRDIILRKMVTDTGLEI